MTKKLIDVKSRDMKWQLDGTRLEDALHQIKQWIQEYGGSATLNITEESEAYSYSDKEYARVYIISKREETDEEYAKRLLEEQQRLSSQQERERREFERLKAKFEGEAK